ncbi:Clavaminate synthase-like protein [Fusarium bulbicola]|nr:Clavaminate synthase-like protein [Fusarium bulbicola]
MTASSSSSKDEFGSNVPDGFPKTLNSTLAWRCENIQHKEAQWKRKLSDEENSAIHSAATGFDVNSQNFAQISTAILPLPIDLSQYLRHLSGKFYNGTGFPILAGLDPSKYPARHNVLLQAGISAHMCPEGGFLDVFAKRPVGMVS